MNELVYTLRAIMSPDPLIDLAALSVAVLVIAAIGVIAFVVGPFESD